MSDHREINLNYYLPDPFKNMNEFDKITDLESTEIRKLLEKCMDLWNDGFILTAGYQGIKKWESLLSIRLDAGLSLEERRTTVLASWNKQLPYTEIKLREQLTALLGTDYNLDIWNQRYELRLIVKERPYSVIKSIRKMVKEIIPANLISEFYGRYPASYMEPINCDTVIRFQIRFYPRYNLPYLFLDRTWSLDNRQSLNGYNGEESLNFYPLKLNISAEISESAYFKEQFHIALAIQKHQITAFNTFSIRNRADEKVTLAERFSFNMQVKARAEPGQVTVMNRNEADSTWILSGSRRLNGGQTIL